MIRVLIIEDDNALAELHHRYLHDIQGFDVVGIATSQKEALLQLEILKPELILLDVYLPDGHGIDILQEIRSKQLTADVILITAARDVDTLQQAMRGGVVDYLLKPVMFPRLESALNKYREQKHKLNHSSNIDQSMVDKMFSNPTPQQSSRQLPKGIDGVTLDKIQALYQLENNLTADMAGEKIGVSRTTARRYLEYLTSTGELVADLHYGTVGRPERSYAKATVHK
ncbi:response regulator [Vibrio maerlii]|uniref:response regulator n=1 Tax=Vibrio maerlii TaxID=2231648 RepID=UPI000E3EE176|nr:response regulator [Vibrio maerlii]